MFKSLRTITKIPDLRNKILFTLGMLVLYRVGSYVMVPGIDQNAVTTIKEQAKAGGVLGFLTLFSGKALTNFAVFALGIMPYITASIILQLLTVVVPSLERLQKEGEVGQQKITQYTRYLTVALAFAQSIGYVFLFQSFQNEAGTGVDIEATFSRICSGVLPPGMMLATTSGALQKCRAAVRRSVPCSLARAWARLRLSGMPSGIFLL